MATTVIFDVGGVILDWNPRHLYRKLFDGDETAMERFLAEVCTHDWNVQQDAGRPFATAVAELSTEHPDHADLIAAFHLRWEEMVRGHFHDTVAIVEDLKKRRVPLYALTNFSIEKWSLTKPRYPVFELFDGIVVSGGVGMVKPDPRVYRLLLERFQLSAKDCLFVDDAPANVSGAEAVGMKAHRYTSAAALRRDLEDRALL